MFVLTPKGLHVLERFISKNGISAEPLAKVFSSQPICLKLLHLERRSSDDEIIISQAVVTALFRRFAGRSPNYMPDTGVPLDPSQEYHERSKGIPLMDVTERQQGIIGRSNVNVFKTFCSSSERRLRDTTLKARRTSRDSNITPVAANCAVRHRTHHPGAASGTTQKKICTPPPSGFATGPPS